MHTNNLLIRTQPAVVALPRIQPPRATTTAETAHALKHICNEVRQHATNTHAKEALTLSAQDTSHLRRCQHSANIAYLLLLCAPSHHYEFRCQPIFRTVLYRLPTRTTLLPCCYAHTFLQVCKTRKLRILFTTHIFDGVVC